MQNVVNGHSEQNHSHQLSEDPADTKSPSVHFEDAVDQPNGYSHDHDDGGEPASKRRKLAESNAHKQLPRPVSPPWKRSHAEGPTSFVEGGRRKSGRTNAVPLELQPQSSKRQTRAAFDKAAGDQKSMKPSYNVAQKKPTNGVAHIKSNQVANKHTPTKPIKSRSSETPAPMNKEHAGKSKASPAVTKIAELQAQLAKLKQDVKARRRRSSVQSEDIDASEVESRSDAASDESDAIASLIDPRPPSPLALSKVKFRVSLPKPTVTAPANQPSAKNFASFEDFLSQDDTEPLLGYGHENLSAEQVRNEASMRRRVREAQQPGHLLDKRNLTRTVDRQNEPKRQFSHQDHLLAHVVHFRKLLRDEHRTHRKQAEIIAHEAKRYFEDKIKRNRKKTRAEIEQEERERALAIYKSVIKDIAKLWTAVLAEVAAIRQKEYEDQQQAKMKGHLARVLDRTDQMLNRDVELSESDLGSGDDSQESSDGGDTDDSEQMSDSSSDTSHNSEANDKDADMTIDELRQKYADVPELEKQDSAMDSDDDIPEVHAEDDDDDSDPETEMDSEFDTDGTGSEESDAEDGSEAQDEAPTSGLLSLFTKQEISDLAVDETLSPTSDANKSQMQFEEPLVDLPAVLEAGRLQRDQTSEADDEEDSDPDIEMDSEFDTDDSQSDNSSSEEDDAQEAEVHNDGGLLSLFTEAEVVDMTTKAAPDSLAEVKDPAFATPPDRGQVDSTEMDGIVIDTPIPEVTLNQPEVCHMDFDGQAAPEPPSHDTSSQASPRTSATKASLPESTSSMEEIPGKPEDSDIQTPVPKLLRGTLRIYQHEGLDWMAKLYANGRSGILADEMGLGKTIQSISLLAHLAEVHEVWGPHLIVVPTSVMLNWEMEFKKFLPGFKILTYYGNQEERKQKRRGWMADDSFNVCITSYQLVLQDANSFKRRRWHYMILDEAHNIKNFRSERWQTMMTFNTQARLLLTGTPLQNNLTELWSLLFFLHYGQETDNDDDAFAGLKEWSEWFKRPVESILEHNKQVLDEEDREQVAKLHKVIRPFLLRRLKADVEKQMPLKYEHVEMCRLSKRQRQLYDGFMSRAQTRETLSSGNYLSIINALMQLRKVCNHPDLFETRPINTSFAMPKAIAASYEIQDLLVRRRVLADAQSRADLDFLQLVPISDESKSMIEFQETSRRHAFNQIKTMRDNQWRRIQDDLSWHGEQRISVLASLENAGRKSRLSELDRAMYFEAYRHHQHPIYGRALLEKLRIGTKYDKLSFPTTKAYLATSWEGKSTADAIGLVQSIQTRSDAMEPYVRKFACITPAVVANDFSKLFVTEASSSTLRESQLVKTPDPFHQARMKLSIAFPDKRLLQYDCGKLQRLDKLLRQLQTGGHRALIFTQMTKVLDILEQFLNIHGHLYLRLDGATKIEQRQILTERFNNDKRILCFILSSRSGGLGINLTGADTVIFYDLDWNPAMDKQCTDRAHRIGQTRDVHIYRFVSEHTIESNILRKANQKQLLDDVVIQKGDFTTDYKNKFNYKDMLDQSAEEDEAGRAMDRVLGNDRVNVQAFEQVEDREDTAAAKVAQREVQHADDGDFEEKATSTTPQAENAQTSGPFGAANAAIDEADATGGEGGHIDEYMLKMQKWLLKDVPLGPAKERSKNSKRRRRDEHRVRRR